MPANSKGEGDPLDDGVAAVEVGSPVCRQSQQAALCAGPRSVPSPVADPSVATHLTPLLVQISVMSRRDCSGDEKTMLQLTTRQSRTHRCKAPLGLFKLFMRGLYVRFDSHEMNI